MNPSQETSVSRLYFKPGQGWSTDPVGATLRLDAAAIERRVVESQNIVYEPDGKGGWRAVTDESQLDAEERGMKWETWRTAAEGEPYVAFRGLRVVDEELAEGPLLGLKIRDEQGLIRTEPLRAGRLFLLSEEEAVEFVRRLKAAAGSLGWGSPIPDSVQVQLRRLRALARRVEEEREQDAKAIVLARGGNLSGVAGFEARTRPFLSFCSESSDAYISCRRGLAHLLAQGKTAAEREEASALLYEARSLRDQVVVAREERDDDAAELSWRAGRGGEQGPRPSTGAQLAARAIGRLAAAQGYEVSEEDGVTVIRLAQGTLRLGAEFRFDATPKQS